MKLIVAADDEFGIGKDGDLLTFLPEDLEFFKQNTVNQAIVIGRKTLESFKNGNPLPKRKNLVFSRTKQYDHDRIVNIDSVETLQEWIKNNPENEVFVSGGGVIYELLLPYCETALVTRLEGNFDADTFMPNLEEHPNWMCIEQGPLIEEGDVRYRHTVWKNSQVISCK